MRPQSSLGGGSTAPLWRYALLFIDDCEQTTILTLPDAIHARLSELQELISDDATIAWQKKRVRKSVMFSPTGSHTSIRFEPRHSSIDVPRPPVPVLHITPASRRQSTVLDAIDEGAPDAEDSGGSSETSDILVQMDEEMPELTHQQSEAMLHEYHAQERARERWHSLSLNLKDVIRCAMSISTTIS